MKTIAKIMLLGALGVLLSGCRLDKVKPVVVVTENAPKSVCRGVPKPDRIYTKDVQWFVVKDEHGIIWIALTPKHYENLSLNTQSLLSLAQQQKKIIKFYEKCLTDDKSKEKSPKN